MSRMNAAKTIAPTITPPLTWAEICERYPNQQVYLVEMDRIHPRGLEFRTARVIGHGQTRREAFEQARALRDRYVEGGCRFTGQSRKPLVRPTVILDDEIRNAIRY
jgi:hypothetical protein